MKKVFFAVIIWCIPSVLFSQVLTQRFAKGEAVEKGVKIKKEITSGSIIELPKVDIEKLLMEDAEVAGEDVPYRFGYGFDTSYSLKDGEWDNVEGGRLSMTRDWYLSYPNGFQEIKRVDRVGASHNGIPTPHVHENGKVRPAKDGDL